MRDDDAEGSKPGEESASPEKDIVVDPDATTTRSPSRSERPPPAPGGTSDPAWASLSPVESFTAPEVPSATCESPATPGSVGSRVEGRVDGWVDSTDTGGRGGAGGTRGDIRGQTVARVEDTERGGTRMSGVSEEDSDDSKDREGDGLLIRSESLRRFSMDPLPHINDASVGGVAIGRDDPFRRSFDGFGDDKLGEVGGPKARRGSGSGSAVERTPVIRGPFEAPSHQASLSKAGMAETQSSNRGQAAWQVDSDKLAVGTAKEASRGSPARVWNDTRFENEPQLAAGTRKTRPGHSAKGNKSSNGGEHRKELAEADRWSDANDWGDASTLLDADEEDFMESLLLDE